MKSNEKLSSPDVTELFNAILNLNDISEARKFFRDLLTEQEIIEFAQRWKVAQMLYKNIPYSDIEKQTGMSSTTIARISKWLTNGMGGYQLMLSRLNKDHHHHESYSSLEDDS